ncbi:hypothetical protein B0H14DRAFT_2560422 [Mycena olivaceomarginata]|nr:hypothetical protein B0H14DRAFT_2560422 [Mycena olivaceomarginata]
MAIRWGMKPYIKIDIRSFENFRSLCLGDLQTLENTVAGYDLVFGGAEYTIDSVEEQHFNDEAEERRYVIRMVNLRRITAVWPDPESSWAARFKFTTVQQFDRIAKDITHSNRPKTSLLSGVHQYKEGIVLKREASCAAKHRHFFDRASKVLAGVIADMLRRFGEWRIYIVGEETIGIVATTPVEEAQNEKFQECTANYALEEFRVGGTQAERRHARQQLERFAIDTRNAMIANEESIYLHQSNMRQFTLEDFDYCVNEIELGGNGVCMFARTDVASRVGDELLGQMVLFVSEHKKGLQALNSSGIGKKQKRKKRVVTCKTCGQSGHNMRTCQGRHAENAPASLENRAA